MGHSFDTFVVSSSNNIAYAAAVAVAENPDGQMYNPLFLYSGPGLGKTHLMHSIARYILENHPEYTVMYTTSENFMNNVVEAIRTNQKKQDTVATSNLRKNYRNVDVLLIDDIQFIIGKDSTQIEFFNTFEALYQSGKQLVISSDRPPSQMEHLDMRYRSRFNSGMTIDIQPPDYETRMAILKNKAKNLGLNLSDDVCNYIAINVTNNVRQIEGTVKKILAYRDLNNMPLDLPNISRAIDDMFKSEGNALPTPSLIISQVCKFYSIDEVLLRGTQKNKGTAEARQIAMYLIRKLTNLSLPDIGKEFARDHSTVLYAIRKVEVALKNGDTTMQNNIRDITANINSCL